MAHPSQESSFDDIPRHKYERLKQENIELGCKLMETEEELKRLRASSFVTAVPVEEYEKLKAENKKLEAEVKRLRDGLDGLATHIWG